MPNDYFQFKQFTVHQDRCAMKVCTDSCILGAYADITDAKRILDIGTGTGLLALMMAQRSDARIDAVEIDRDAGEQASENVMESPWQSQIHVHHAPIQAFSVRTEARYDLIVTNPPFFANNYKRTNPAQNVALHGESLTLAELAVLSNHLLEPDGQLVVMLPPHESQVLEESAANSRLIPQKQLFVHNRPGGKPIRIITTFGRSATDRVTDDHLYIWGADGLYSEEFRRLLRAYYLAF